MNIFTLQKENFQNCGWCTNQNFM